MWLHGSKWIYVSFGVEFLSFIKFRNHISNLNAPKEDMLIGYNMKFGSKKENKLFENQQMNNGTYIAYLSKRN